VLVDYAARPESGPVRAGSDAAEACWVPISEVERFDTTAGLVDMIRRAVAVSQGGSE
jgi:hypothetical protein